MHLNAVWLLIQFHEATLSAGEQRYVRKTCIATVGAVSNAQHANRTIGKAGLSRHMGVRPTTRAMATNPCDHPMGGKAKKCACSLLVLAFFFLAAYMMQSWPCSLGCIRRMLLRAERCTDNARWPMFQGTRKVHNIQWIL